MPDHQSDTISDSSRNTRLEKISVWLLLAAAILGVAGANAFLIVEIVPKLSWISAVGLAGVLAGLCGGLAGLCLIIIVNRNLDREARRDLLKLIAEVQAQKIVAKAAETTARYERTSLFPSDRTLMTSIVGENKNLKLYENLEPSTRRTTRWRPKEEEILGSDFFLNPDLSTSEGNHLQISDAPGLDAGSNADPIGKLKGLLDDLADRDGMAMRASLEQTKTVVRGQPVNPCEYRVWYGTDRRLNVDGDIAQGFAEEFSDTLRCGSCVVYVPKSHEFASLGSGPLARIVKKISGKPTDAPLKLLAIEAGTPESFVLDLQTGLRQLPENERDVVLFIHGYNVDFESAAIRAAQVGRDLELPGPMLFYSWPSKAKLFGYGADGETIGRTLKKFISFLDVLLAIPEVTAVNVIAHSMGNRLFQRAMQLLSVRNDVEAKRFGHVVLAAPDIDRETFREAADDYARLKQNPDRRTTVYFNKNDFAIGISGWIHEEARLGTQGNAFTNTDSILWIDSWFRLDWLGHGYFASAAPVLKDMKELLVGNKAPVQRQPPLNPVPSDVPQYWELRA
jgi:esterase/lipase superfamily enzyme